MIRIECEAPTTSRCPCCGNVTLRLTRFVYSDDNAHAVYYAAFTPGHAEKRLCGLIGLGEWGEGSQPADRVAFPFEIRTNHDNFQVGLTNAADSPWRDVQFLGRVLDRAESLLHPRIRDVFHITDHMVTDDKAIAEYFG